MPPIVPLIVGAPLASIVPVLLKPLPVMVYEIVFSVTPGATVRFTPSVPTCAAPSATGSLEHASSAPLPPIASNQMRGTLPSLVTSSEPLRQFFIASIPFVEPRPARRKGALERLTTEIGGHGASSYSGQ